MKIIFTKRPGLLLVAAGLLLQLASCVSTEPEASTSTVDPRATYTPPAVGHHIRVGNKTVLHTVRATHTFSNSNTEDSFVLQLRGARILTAKAHLMVLSSTGDTLRHEVLPARALLEVVGELKNPQSATVRELEVAILSGMNSFFEAGHFTQPAVLAGATQPAALDAKTWTALRDDPGTVGFDYFTGGGECRLTYARKLGKIVIINQ